MYLVISAFITDQPFQQFAGDWGKYFCREDFHDLYPSIRYHSGVKSRRMRWTGQLACMVEYKINRF
jgi:hypothetical protein